MNTKDRFKEAKQLAAIAIENYGSTVEAMIILDISVAICKALLDEKYYAKHPEERPAKK